MAIHRPFEDRPVGGADSCISNGDIVVVRTETKSTTEEVAVSPEPGSKEDVEAADAAAEVIPPKALGEITVENGVIRPVDVTAELSNTKDEPKPEGEAAPAA